MRKCPISGKPCGKVPTVHVTETVNGKANEMMLCDDCGRQYLSVPKKGPVTNLFDKLFGPLVVAAREEPVVPPPRACGCGMTLPEFVHAGRLGCEHCYATFADELSVVMPRAGQGSEDHGLTHVGKRPKSDLQKPAADAAPQHQDPVAEIKRLEDLMASAVKDERYEDAAKCRDAIKSLRA